MGKREEQEENMGRYGWLMHAMEQFHKAAALVSDDMMVLEHTETCEAVLDSGGFYSVQDWLPAAACAAIRACIENGETQTVSADLGHMRCRIQMIPLEKEALLIFEGMQEEFPALLLSALRLREKAEDLLRIAEKLRNVEGAAQEAAEVRSIAMQLLRQAQHTEVLGSSGVSSAPKSCDAGQLAQDAANAICQHGYDARAWVETGLFITADPVLVQAALLTLAANSIQAGAAHIIIKAARQGDRVLLRVEDDGPGMLREAVQRMRDGWRMSGSELLHPNWGFGLPFAVRVAEMHGGQLYHIANTKAEGCVMCLALPEQESDEVEAPGIYVDSVLDPAETELSVLE